MKVALTGGIGCGKSTAARFFYDSGWRTLDTDQIVASLLEEDQSIRDQIRDQWGEAVFNGPGGSIDRKAIARIVFSSLDELKWLERILHPVVRITWTNAIEADSKSNWLVEIPLLFEKSLENSFDKVVCVFSDRFVADNRLAGRGFSKAEICRRRSLQLPLEKKALLSDHVLLNSGNLDFLKKQTLRLIKQLCVA